MFFVLVVVETVFVNCPASSFSLLPFALLPSFFGRSLISFHAFTRGPQAQGQSTTRPQDQNHRTRGPEDHRTRGPQDQRTTGPEDQRTSGAQGQRSLNFFSRGCKYFFQGTWIFFPGNVNLFSSIIPSKHIPRKQSEHWKQILPHAGGMILFALNTTLVNTHYLVTVNAHLYRDRATPCNTST